MQIFENDITYNIHSKNNIPSGTVKENEIFKVHTELNGGKWLQNKDDEWDPSKSKGPNLAVVLKIEEAKKGDYLAVDIIDIKVEEVGYTGFVGWRTKITRDIYPNDWDVVTKTVEIKNNEIIWSDNLRLEVKPMIGTLGVAPIEDYVNNQLMGKHGGNFDVQEITNGTTVYLPVNVDGALLHIGDCHAIMGDGEICSGGGIECRALVTLKVRVIKNKKPTEWIRMENEEYIMAVASNESLEEACHLSIRELIRYMVEDYGFKEKEAYLLLGQVLEARGTAFIIDKSKQYIAKIKKKYLKPDKNFKPIKDGIERCCL